MKKKDTSIAACIYLDNKILLIKRRDVPVWVLPGGGIETESPEDACIREVMEETNYKVEITKKIGEYTPINRLTRFTHLFLCKTISGKPKISSETKDIKFFDINNLPKMPPPYLDWINDSLKNKPLIKKKLDQVTYFKFLKYLILHPILVIRFILARIGLSINT